MTAVGAAAEATMTDVAAAGAAMMMTAVGAEVKPLLALEHMRLILSSKLSHILY